MSDPSVPPSGLDLGETAPDAGPIERIAQIEVGGIGIERGVVELDPFAVSTQTTSAEHAAVRASRLRREERDAEHKLWMEKLRFVAAAGIVGVVLVVCLAVVVWPDVSAANKEQAWRVIYLAIGAVAGYVAGRST